MGLTRASFLLIGSKVGRNREVVASRKGGLPRPWETGSVSGLVQGQPLAGISLPKATPFPLLELLQCKLGCLGAYEKDFGLLQFEFFMPNLASFFHRC